jgi:hypothetical protein
MRFRPSDSRRIFHAVCMIFVVAYIFFDVLDLDGSRLSSFTIPFEQTYIVAEAPLEMESVHRPDRAGLWDESIVVNQGLHAVLRTNAPLSRRPAARRHHRSLIKSSSRFSSVVCDLLVAANVLKATQEAL